MVILATDYREECVVQSKDRLNGLCKSVGLARSDCFFANTLDNRRCERYCR